MSELTELTDLEKGFIKKYGKGVIVPASFIEDVKREIISVGPKLDVGLGGGIPTGHWVLLSGLNKVGKAQPLDSIVYTPNGPVYMKDLKNGDIVSTPCGGLSRINGVYPQGKKDVYKITFCDGHSVKSTLDHNWYVSYNRSKDYNVKTLKEMLDIGISCKTGENHWRIPTTQPVVFNKKDLTIDPYIMGVLLGDGYLSRGATMISSKDKEIINEVNKRMFYEFKFKKKNGDNCDWILFTNGKMNIMRFFLDEYGLKGAKSRTKFIPKDYMYSSIDDRILLLKGLMDTDGTISKKGVCLYSSASEQLILDVKELVQSLGGTCSIKDRHTTCNNKTFYSYRMRITFRDNSICFFLDRKLAKVKKRKGMVGQYRTIKNIEYVGEKECQCIHISNDKNLYITDNYTVTHNTTMALQIAANFQKLGRPVWYMDAENRWKMINLYGVRGFDGDKARVIHSTIDAQLAGEDYLLMALDIFKDPANQGGLMIIDSTSALCPRDVLASGEVSGKRRSSTPKLIKDFIHQARGLVPIMDFTVILIQHLIMNTSGYGKQWLSDGGTELQHQKDVHIQCTKTPVALMDGEKHIGQIVTWDVITSALGPPQHKIESRIRFGYGIDDISENIELAEDFNLIEKKGSWYNLAFMEEPKSIQGIEKVFQFLESRPDVLEDLSTKLKKMIIK